MARLNYNHLHYFWAVAREGNLTRAAEHLHVSQSALSAQIRQLEEQLGQTLFSREGRSLVLTEAGHVALNYADTIFRAGNEMQALLRDNQSARRQTLRIGSVATLSRNFQENFLRPLMGRASVDLVLQSGALDELVQRLYVHDLDAVLSNQPMQGDARNTLRCRRLARQPVSLVGRPLRRRKPFRFPDDIGRFPMVVPGLSSNIRSAFEVMCEQMNVRPDIIAEVDDMALMRLITRDTDSMALMPPVVVRDEIASGRLQEYCAVPGLYENFHVITMVRRFQNPLLKELLKQSGDDILRFTG